jgi:hypothetical protein
MEHQSNRFLTNLCNDSLPLHPGLPLESTFPTNFIEFFVHLQQHEGPVAAQCSVLSERLVKMLERARGKSEREDDLLSDENQESLWLEGEGGGLAPPTRTTT